MGAKLANNASSTLAGAITAGATSLIVANGEGARFPTLGAGDWFPSTLVKIVGGVASYEIVYVTARSGDNFTITRAQEGTTALSFSGGDRIELRPTAAVLSLIEGAETLKNKTLSDSTTFIADEADPTKKAQFQASGIATATTRTITLPNKSGTMAMLDDVATGSAGNNAVTVVTGNGWGSTDTKIRRFATTLSAVGTAITYADSASLGGTFTINEAGIYSMSLWDQGSGANPSIGVSLNSTQLTTDIGSISAATRVFMADANNGSLGFIGAIALSLSPGDVIRVHGIGAFHANAAGVRFSIRKVGAA